MSSYGVWYFYNAVKQKKHITIQRILNDVTLSLVSRNKKLSWKKKSKLIS